VEGTGIFIYLTKFFKTFTLKIECHQLHHPRWPAYLRYTVFSAWLRSSDGRFLSPELLFDTRKRWRHKSCCWVSKMLVNKKKKLNSGLMVSGTEVIKNFCPYFSTEPLSNFSLSLPLSLFFFFLKLVSISLSSQILFLSSYLHPIALPFFHSSTVLYTLQYRKEDPFSSPLPQPR